MTVFQSGVLLTPRSIGMMVASTVTSFSLVKWGYRKPILLGTLTVAAMLLLLSFQSQSVGSLGVGGMWLTTAPLLFVLVGFCGIGHGVATPAANNACIELMPDKVATITGLRGMFRNIGSTLGIAVSTLILNVIPDQQRAFQVVFFAPVILLLLTLPTIFIMPASPNISPISKRAVAEPAKV
jgi:MFS family permease